MEIVTGRIMGATSVARGLQVDGRSKARRKLEPILRIFEASELKQFRMEKVLKKA